jgi:hypothetical protein
MGLDIYFPEDIRNALLAANEASAQTAAQITEAKEPPELLTVTLRAYREGYKAALTTVALAFGLGPQSIMTKGVMHERPIDSGAWDIGILATTSGDCQRVEPSDG